MNRRILALLAAACLLASLLLSLVPLPWLTSTPEVEDDPPTLSGRPSEAGGALHVRGNEVALLDSPLPQQETVATAPKLRAATDSVLRLMGQRLTLAHDVARWKWCHQKPISDPSREAQILDAAVELGRPRGLDPDFVRSFFAAQMEAGKLVQQADFDRWRAESEGPTDAAEDLAGLRARIDRIDTELLDALAAAGPFPWPSSERMAVVKRAGQYLAGAGVDDAVRTRALRPLW